MEIAALALAVIAVFVALAARSKASSFQAKIDEANVDARRRVENAGEETAQALDTMRRLIEELASGRSLTPEMVRDGRLWRDVVPAEGVRMVSAGGTRTLDVRTAGETASGMIAGAMWIPLDELEARVGEVPKDGRPLLVYCAGGERSAAACEFLSRKGLRELFNLQGGFSSWTGPVARAK